MRRACVQTIISAAILLGIVVGGVAAGEGAGIAGNVWFQVAYVPVPPASYDIASDLGLAFSVGGFTFASTTGFDVYGFQSQDLRLALDLGVVTISEELLFEPYFSWNEIRVGVSMTGVFIGVDLILADLAALPPPTLSMGGVLELSGQIGFGVTLTSLTGFGVEDLVHRLEGVEAPHRDRMLTPFRRLRDMCQDAGRWDVTVVPGFFFEEQLVRLEAGSVGLIASNTTWLDDTGLDRMLWEVGYRFEDPAVAFLAVVDLRGWLSISALDFIVDLGLEGVRLTSHTAFVEVPPPSIAPIVYEGQRFAVSFSLCRVLVTSVTVFDDAFFLSEQHVKVAVRADPFMVMGLTSFDATGFTSQCLHVSTGLLGASLYGQVEFSFTGVLGAALGFSLGF
jgi:hypothetical protein